MLNAIGSVSGSARLCHVVFPQTRRWASRMPASPRLRLSIKAPKHRTFTTLLTHVVPCLILWAKHSLCPPSLTYVALAQARRVTHRCIGPRLLASCARHISAALTCRATSSRAVRSNASSSNASCLLVLFFFSFTYSIFVCKVLDKSSLEWR